MLTVIAFLIVIYLFTVVDDFASLIPLFFAVPFFGFLFSFDILNKSHDTLSRTENILPVKENYFVINQDENFYYKKDDSGKIVRCDSVEFKTSEKDTNYIEYYNTDIKTSWIVFPWVFDINEKDTKIIVYIMDYEKTPIQLHEMHETYEMRNE